MIRALNEISENVNSNDPDEEKPTEEEFERRWNEYSSKQLGSN
jgi:hypothetical protein